MIVENDETIAIRSHEDLVRIRRVVRERAVAIGFGLVDQTKIVTAASEITRNAVDYAGGGVLRIEALRLGRRQGLRLTVTDRGPGIPDIERAMTPGYTTGGGLGLGLAGAKRLSSEFAIQSVVGEGTTVTLARWR